MKRQKVSLIGCGIAVVILGYLGLHSFRHEMLLRIERQKITGFLNSHAGYGRVQVGKASNGCNFIRGMVDDRKAMRDLLETLDSIPATHTMRSLQVVHPGDALIDYGNDSVAYWCAKNSASKTDDIKDESRSNVPDQNFNHK